MGLLRRIFRIIMRLVLWGALCLGAGALAYALWTPGQVEIRGIHDKGANGIWISHGWIGDESWFSTYKKKSGPYRDAARISALADLLRTHHVRDVFPHLCPSAEDGRIPPVNAEQVEALLDRFEGFRVMPWIGGRLNVHCFLESDQWRENFCDSAVDLLREHPRLAGVHVNIEPMRTGNQDFVALLRMLKKRLPKGKMLSVAAYTPSKPWYPVIAVHWDKEYFTAVSSSVDQVAVMMYDSAAPLPKIYKFLVSSWIQDVLEWVEDSEVLFGTPAYDHTGVLYHSPRVENLQTALAGVHAGLARFEALPAAYRGVAIYSEWEMDEMEWDYFRRHFNSH